MEAFELLGSDADETRLLRAPRAGYSVALGGHPYLVPAPEGRVKYDFVVKLRDINVTHGFRIDDLPTEMDPRVLARTLATVYASGRASRASDVRPVPERLRPPSSKSGAQAIYTLRDAAVPTMEQVWILMRPSASGLYALYHTTWFANADVNTIKWGHLRASFIDQHEWDIAKPRDASPTIWPHSDITMPSAKLDLTEDHWREAGAKAGDLEHASSETAVAVIDVLRRYSQSDRAPREALHELVIDDVCADVSRACSREVAAILVRNVRLCRTWHDLRGWAWQCAWALGNRGWRPES